MSFHFNRIFSRSNNAPLQRDEPVVHQEEQTIRDGARFVPMPGSLLLEKNQEILRRIRLCYGTELDQFNREVTPVVERYADFVSTLPATANNYYNFPGGLLQLGLHTAFFALQATDAQIFKGRGTITARRHLEPRWRYATFIAGLCAELQPLLQVAIITTEDGAAWPSYLYPISTWIARHPGARFRISWNAQPPIDGIQNLYAIAHIVPSESMEYLSDNNHLIVPAMLSSLSRLPLPGLPSSMTALVRRAAALSIEKDLQRISASRGKKIYGDHLARLLLDVMHDLVRANANWLPNSEKSRVWQMQNGTYVIWPMAYNDILAYADRERLQGVPESADLAMEVLRAGGMLEESPEGAIWSIRPPGTHADLEALKLARPELMLRIQRDQQDSVPPTNPSADAGETAPKKNAAPAQTPAPDDRPSQLELPLSGSQSSHRSDTAVPTCGLALVNCMRLPADVAEALRRSLSQFNPADTTPPVHLIREGLLVPLKLFIDAGLDVRQATSCLRDAGMLVVGESGTANYRATLNGVEVRGLVIKREHVSGLAPTAKPDEGHHVDPSI